MTAMAAKIASILLKRHDKVRANIDLPVVPAGTPGKVLVASGITWLRYRVLFENGVDIGSLDGSVLARPRDFEAALERRRTAAEEATVAAEAAEAGNGESAGGGEGTVVNGVTIPAHLLERSKRARERLGV